MGRCCVCQTGRKAFRLHYVSLPRTDIQTPHRKATARIAKRRQAGDRWTRDKTVRVYVIFRDCRVPRVKLDGARTTRTASECRSSRDKLPLNPPLRKWILQPNCGCLHADHCPPNSPLDLSWATSRLLPGSDECMSDQDKASVRRVFLFSGGMATHRRHSASQKKRSVCFYL